MAPRRRVLLRALAIVVVLGSGIAAATLLVLNLSLVRQAGRFEQPVRVSTSDYTVTNEPKSVVTIRVVFPVEGRTVRAKLGGPTHVVSDVTPTLRIVYDANDPDRTMLAEDFDSADGARTTTWITGAILLVDLVVVLLAIVLGARSSTRARPTAV